MPTAAGPASPADRAAAPVGPAVIPLQQAPVDAPPFAKDAIISWFRGEFAAANAIIDALCGHLAQLEGRSDYEAVFTAIHRRRLNWIPVLQMQKYHSIADVAVELRRVTAMKLESKVNANGDVDHEKSEGANGSVEEREKAEEKVMENKGNDEAGEEDGSLESDVTDSGSQEVHAAPENIDINICSNHEECESRPAQIKLTKGFSAKEHVKGHTVNVVRGLKLFEDVFTDSELSKLTNFVNELRVAGQNGELSGESFVLFNKQMKGNRREMIQFGVPIFGRIKEEATTNSQSVLEPIPALLQGVIDHLVQWHLLPEHKIPNGCIINFFDEGEFSQPFLKPPHLDQPISTLLLSESTIAFGRTLTSDCNGNYKAPLSVPLKKGSLLVMRGNSSDLAGHVMCASPNERISITFFKVRQESIQPPSPTSPNPSTAMTVWQPDVPTPYTMQNGSVNGYEATNLMPKWGVLRAPVMMLAPVRPMVLNPRKLPSGGTGVFLPWNMSSRKHVKHLPPRAQKGRVLALTSQAETRADALESTSE